jgi:short-chain 2-methylacyl-CoA dehydrogenase
MDEDHHRMRTVTVRQVQIGQLRAIGAVAMGPPAREEQIAQEDGAPRTFARDAPPGATHALHRAGHRRWIPVIRRSILEGVTCENGPAVDFDLSADHQLIRRTVREFAEGEVAPVAEELDRNKAFPYEIVAKLGKLNLMGIPFPLEYGGGGADTLAYALAVEELTRVDSSVAITLCAHTSLGTQPVYLFGSEQQKREWLPRLCSGELLGAFGLTEPEAGSDAANTRTRAQLKDGEWVVNGAKQFITNAGTEISGMVCITAVTSQKGARDGAHASNSPPNGEAAPKEISNVIIPNGTPGYEQGEPYRKMGWNASDTRPLSFTECRVPEGNLLGPRGAGLKQFLHILDIGRIGVAAMGVGLAQGALDQALQYAKQRMAFGKPISKFQAIQGKLADMATEIEAARLLVYKAAREKDAGRNFTLTAAQAKLKTGRLAVRCAEEAVQIHGGYGFIEEYPVCRFYRDAKILTIGEGTDEIQQLVIARALGA